MTNVSPRQKTHVLRLMEDALDSTQVGKADLQRLADRGGDFKAALMTLIGRYSAKVSDFTLVREILGDDFITPEEIAAARGIIYTEEQIEHLKRTLPDRETLEWLRRNDFMLVAGSPRDMSLLDIRELERHYFCSKEDGWYSKSKQVFARDEMVTCRWLMLRKGIVPKSTFKTWGDQKKLLSDLEVVHITAEQVWGMTVYKAVRNIYLLGTLSVRTLSVDSNGHRVDVGYFNDDGLCINHWSGSPLDRYIGVASSREF